MSQYIYWAYIYTKPIYYQADIYIYIYIYAGRNNIKLTKLIHDVYVNETKLIHGKIMTA